MSTRAKWIVGLLLLGGIWLVLRRKASQTGGEIPRFSPPRTGLDLTSLVRGNAEDVARKLKSIQDIANDTWGGNGNTHLVEAGPNYPGYYRTDDGGYVNPDTGAAFSPGSSPPVTHNSNDDPPKVVVDLNAQVPILDAQPLPPGDVIL